MEEAAGMECVLASLACFGFVSPDGVHSVLKFRVCLQASATRDYLHTLNQEGETLPPGPVIISPDGLFPSLYRELVGATGSLLPCYRG